MANAVTVLFDCSDGHGYIETSTRVWNDDESGKLFASVNVHDIENSPDYFVKLSNLKKTDNANGTITVSSKVKGRYLLEVSADKKTAFLTASNLSKMELSCK